MKNTDYLLNFVLPSGATGPTGPTGPAGIARSAYLVTFPDVTAPTGITVESEEKLPINHKELDISNLIELNETEDTLKFNAIGYYKITFTVSAYSKYNGTSFDPTKDFVSIGFKNEETGDVFIGTSAWTQNDIAEELVGQGIIAVVNTTDHYILENLSNQALCLNSPDLANIMSQSYFSTPLVTIVVEYLGRQGS